MAPRRRVIIDTDPGVDDIWALLLALAAKSEELEVLLISCTYGNVEVRNCLRNVVAMFHILDRELEWRRQNGKPEGFEGLKSKPIVAVGAEGPLNEELIIAAYFHGRDGLADIHASHPHLSPEDTWKKLFEKPPPEEVSKVLPDTSPASAQESLSPPISFTPSLEPSHREILRLLRTNPPNTITIISIGPLTNLALAAAEDPETFLRVREVVSMGGAIDLDGNVTPVAEFNILADAVAAARVFALTAPDPASTMPPPPPPPPSNGDPHPPYLSPYPTRLPTRLPLTLFPLDITETHTLPNALFTAKVRPLIAQGSPLAEWLSAFTSATYAKISTLHSGPPSFALHDSLCVWYAITSDSPDWHLSPSSTVPPPEGQEGEGEDVRVEVAGQWTRGMTVVDRRSRMRRDGGDKESDEGDWLGRRSGNRLRRMVASPGEEKYVHYLLGRILGE
ncbi:MAG: hypothetical protein Q9160_009162 [Pyrenula sp. 1 TL-2023]